jgi:hypothetical protein
MAQQGKHIKQAADYRQSPRRFLAKFKNINEWGCYVRVEVKKSTVLLWLGLGAGRAGDGSQRY